MGADLKPLVTQNPIRLMRSFSYGFPEAVLDAGAERSVKVDLKALFRPERIVMVGSMDETRGHYRIKRSRLPLLNRDSVIAHSRIYKGRRGKKVWFRKGRTTVAFSGDGERKSLVRDYLPSSVEYIHTDPLSYVILRNLFCGEEAAMPSGGKGASALWFGANRFGNSVPLPATSTWVSMLLKNCGDIQVRVRAMIFGVGFE